MIDFQKAPHARRKLLEKLLEYKTIIDESKTLRNYLIQLNFQFLFLPVSYINNWKLLLWQLIMGPLTNTFLWIQYQTPWASNFFNWAEALALWRVENLKVLALNGRVVANALTWLWVVVESGIANWCYNWNALTRFVIESISFLAQHRLETNAAACV